MGGLPHGKAGSSWIPVGGGPSTSRRRPAEGLRAASHPAVRVCVTIGLLAALFAGCGASGGAQRGATTPTDRERTSAASRIDKCVERLLSGSTTNGAGQQEVRRYARDTYCAPFERNGWVYEDGALGIAAQKWLDGGRACESATGSATGPTRTVPCAQASRDAAIDCALLRHVRRTEATAYVAELQRDGNVRCDDGTPLGELGVP